MKGAKEGKEEEEEEGEGNSKGCVVSSDGQPDYHIFQMTWIYLQPGDCPS